MRAFALASSARASAATSGVNLSMKLSSSRWASAIVADHLVMPDRSLELEQVIGVEIVIFGEGHVVAGEAPDRRLVLPESEHLDMDDVAFGPVQAQRRDVAGRRAVVGDSGPR